MASEELGKPGQDLIAWVRTSLLDWGSENGRKYPWRETRNPYRIMIAEILLHRTRADQVVSVYEEFMKHFPDVDSLAQADPEAVSRIVHRLGLHWRVPLILELATQIRSRHSGSVPRDNSSLLNLPGVGEYTAAAVRCFAWGEPEPLLDTNTVRVVGRVFGIPITDGSRRSKRFRTLSRALVDGIKAREFNLALIDLGALLCRPSRPLCDICPINDVCAFPKLKN